LKVLAVSVLLQAVGTAALICVLRALGDPMSSLDAAITVLSLIATWWLIRSYKEQWLVWIGAVLMYVGAILFPPNADAANGSGSVMENAPNIACPPQNPGRQG